MFLRLREDGDFQGVLVDCDDPRHRMRGGYFGGVAVPEPAGAHSARRLVGLLGCLQRSRCGGLAPAVSLPGRHHHRV
jgi:hypothetical protein